MNSEVDDLTTKSSHVRQNRMVSRNNYRTLITKYCLLTDRFRRLTGSRRLGIIPGHERRIRCVRPIEVLRAASNKVVI
jgi:hypothetical protein